MEDFWVSVGFRVGILMDWVKNLVWRVERAVMEF